MPDTLCIAELADGRRALCYINPEEGKAQLVLVLRPEDLKPQPWKLRDDIDRAVRQRVVPVSALPQALQEAILGEIASARPLPIPPPPPKPRITPEDLLRRAQEAKQDEPQTREEKTLDDIERLRRGDQPEA